MVDRDVILRRTQEIEKHLQRLSSYDGLPAEQFLADPVAQDVA